MTILAVFPAAAFCLGTWQVYRLQWKLDLIKRTNDALAKDPIPLDPTTLSATSTSSQSASTSSAAEEQHTKVAIDGHVDPLVEFRVAPRVRDGEPGFFAISPFVLSNGDRILLNRGWIARDKEADGTRADPKLTETSVVGLFKRDNKRPSWSHDNKPEAGQWYWTDVDAMAKLAKTQAVLVDAVDSVSDPEAKRRRDLGLPIPRPPTATFKNNHLEYAVTWYSLCAATTAILVLRRRRAAGGAAAAGMARFGRARMV